MHRLLLATAWVVLGATSVVAHADIPPPPTRLAVVITSNVGLSSEENLVYADEDGTRVIQALTEVGAVATSDVFVATDADLDQLTEAIGHAVVRAATIRDAGGEVEVLLYYTGHAGTDGLHLHGETLSLAALKTAARVIPAQRRIFAIDACQSGQLFRSKGTQMVDVRTEPVEFTPPDDEAWITSSGPEERSYEVDGRRGSLFTHFFVSGLRGAADGDHDQLVTLPELMRFVSLQTSTTAATLGQVQQPRWKGAFNDFVVGDLRNPPAALQIEGPVRAPLLVIHRDTVQVVAELPIGAGGYLALAPGAYQLLAVVSSGRPQVADVTLAPGAVHTVDLESELVAVRGVRSKGGLLLRRPWSLSTGYSLAVGATPGRPDGHGLWVGLRRALGGGHTIGLQVTGLANATTHEFTVIGNRTLRVGADWTTDVSWRTVRWGPGARISGGILRQAAQRRDDGYWGRWYGINDGAQLGRIGLAQAEALLFAVIPAGALELHATTSVGAAVLGAEQMRVLPIGGLELGVGVAF